MRQTTLFALTDWLGTKRVEVGANPCATAYTSLPFGDSLTPASVSGFSACQDDATENHFTGKERDAESGNDYFGARYYASTMGRFLQPRPSAQQWTARQPAELESLFLCFEQSTSSNRPYWYVHPRDSDGQDCKQCHQ